jgi:hypothetical protein
MRTPRVTTLHVAPSVATLEDIAADFERRAAVCAGAHALGLAPEEPEVPARLVESRVWEEAARILRKVAAEKEKR